MTCSRHNLCITDSVANIVYEFNQQRVWNTSAILLIHTKTRNTNGEGRNTKSYLYGTIYTDTTAGPSYKPHAKPPGPVNVKSADRKDNWELHKQLWENYCILAGIENAEPRIQRAEFINTLGPDTLRICNGLGLKSEDTVDEIIKRIDEYCIGEVHKVMEQFNFNNRDQRPGESVNDYIAALRNVWCPYSVIVFNHRV